LIESDEDRPRSRRRATFPITASPPHCSLDEDISILKTQGTSSSASVRGRDEYDRLQSTLRADRPRPWAWRCYQYCSASACSCKRPDWANIRSIPSRRRCQVHSQPPDRANSPLADITHSSISDSTATVAPPIFYSEARDVTRTEFAAVDTHLRHTDVLHEAVVLQKRRAIARFLFIDGLLQPRPADRACFSHRGWGGGGGGGRYEDWESACCPRRALAVPCRIGAPLLPYRVHRAPGGWQCAFRSSSDGNGHVYPATTWAR